MELLTLAAARASLWRYCSNAAYDESDSVAVAEVNNRLNLAAERFFSSGNWRGTLERTVITAYDGIVTLPRSLQTILGVKVDNSKRLVRPIWYEFVGGSCSLAGTTGLNDLGEGWTTFRDIPEALPLRIKSTEVDAATLTLTGKTDAGATFTVEVDLTDPEVDIATLTTKITRLNKPVTDDVVEVYYVDGLTEVLIASLEPGETDANYRRYRASTTTDTVDAICKRAFITATSGLDTMVPNNKGALKLMLMSIQYEDKNDLERGEQYKDRAIALADADRQQFDGDNQTPIYNVTPGLGVSSMPSLDGFGGSGIPAYTHY